MFRVVAVGGTFDELHRGHRALLRRAFEVGDHVLIGLSSDEFAGRMGKPHEVAPYERRLRELRALLTEWGVDGRAEIIPLNDPYGVTLSNGHVEAIIVSRETEPKAREINEKRAAMGLPPLQIIVVEMVLAEDGLPISTTRIRRGEIDREGRLLRRPLPHA